MRQILLLLSALVLLAGCNGNESTTNDDPMSQHFPVEVEPILAPDGEYLYYASLDTVEPQRSSIFRARVDMPVRNDLETPGTLAADTTHSPTVALVSQSLAYLDETLLYECATSSPSCTGIDVGSFYGVAYITDSILALASGDSIYTAGLERTNTNLLVEGWDPRTEGHDSIICVIGSSPTWYIVLANSERVFDTVFTVTGSRPRWPDLYLPQNRLAFTIPAADSFLIRAVNLSTSAVVTVASTHYPKVCIAGPSLIILTGPNGTLNHVGFSPGTPQPWVHVEEE